MNLKELVGIAERERERERALIRFTMYNVVTSKYGVM